jgi:hypothetical protein
MIGNGSAELQGVLKVAVYRSGPRRRQWSSMVDVRQRLPIYLAFF